jgi:hypothetical protein
MLIPVRLSDMVQLAATPILPIAPVGSGARMAEFRATERRPAPQPPPPTPEDPPPPAAAPALFSAEYVADVYARRLRTELALQAEAEVAATALAERRARGRS